MKYWLFLLKTLCLAPVTPFQNEPIIRFKDHVCAHVCVSVFAPVYNQEDRKCPALPLSPYSLEAESLPVPGNRLTPSKSPVSACPSAEVTGEHTIKSDVLPECWRFKVRFPCLCIWCCGMETPPQPQRDRSFFQWNPILTPTLTKAGALSSAHCQFNTCRQQVNTGLKDLDAKTLLRRNLPFLVAKGTWREGSYRLHTCN